MDRIDQQEQFTKKPIPAISEAGRKAQPESDRSPGTSSWLSSAMAIWIAQDDLQSPCMVRPDNASPAR
jgi:hypothetical protein